MRAAINRRLLLGAAAVRCLPLAAQRNRPLGLALYTLRNVLPERPAATLKMAAEIGYTDVEIMRNQVASLMPHLDTAGLRAVSMHFETPLITGNFQAWKDAEMPPIDERYTFDRALEEARNAGIPNVVFNYLPPKERGDLDFYHSLSDKLNKASEKCRSAGIRMWYHNHNFEFMPKAGGRPIDVLLRRLDPKLISLEADLFWLSMAGIDPSAFIREHGPRIIAVHLKDRGSNISVPRYDIASVPHEIYQEVGGGVLDFSSIVKAALSAGVKHYFVEQDHSPAPLASIRRSYAAVRKAGY